MSSPKAAENLPEIPFDAVAEAKLLLRTTRWAALATLTPDTGHPFATLVNVATAPDGSPILLLSQLSAHRRHIAADPRVSLLFYLPKGGDPLAHPRLTLSGRAGIEDDPDRRAALRARFLARHPKSALYADFPDFAFFRVVLDNVHLNGGFGRAAPVTAAQLLTPIDKAADLIASETRALDHMNTDHADFPGLLVAAFGGPAGPSAQEGEWRTIGFDPEGVDVGTDEVLFRVPFPQPVTTSLELRQALVALGQQARANPSPRLRGAG